MAQAIASALRRDLNNHEARRVRVRKVAKDPIFGWRVVLSTGDVAYTNEFQPKADNHVMWNHIDRTIKPLWSVSLSDNLS